MKRHARADAGRDRRVVTLRGLEAPSQRRSARLLSERLRALEHVRTGNRAVLLDDELEGDRRIALGAGGVRHVCIALHDGRRQRRRGRLRLRGRTYQQDREADARSAKKNNHEARFRPSIQSASAFPSRQSGKHASLGSAETGVVALFQPYAASASAPRAWSSARHETGAPSTCCEELAAQGIALDPALEAVGDFLTESGRLAMDAFLDQPVSHCRRSVAKGA
jgi:hypothetical protein